MVLRRRDAVFEAVSLVHPLDGNETVVDVGCGDGGYLLDLRANCNRGILVGVDFSLGMLLGLSPKVAPSSDRRRPSLTLEWGCSGHCARDAHGPVRKMSSREAVTNDKGPGQGDLHGVEVQRAVLHHWLPGPILKSIWHTLHWTIATSLSQLSRCGQSDEFPGAHSSN